MPRPAEKWRAHTTRRPQKSSSSAVSAFGGANAATHSRTVASGVTQGLLVKTVQPVYPEQAKYAHIQGAVVMGAIISKNGDVTDLEVLDGPIELVVSAVNAVRRWKYRPYVLNGEPVEVDTRITVNYTLSF